MNDDEPNLTTVLRELDPAPLSTDFDFWDRPSEQISLRKAKRKRCARPIEIPGGDWRAVTTQRAASR